MRMHLESRPGPRLLFGYKAFGGTVADLSDNPRGEGLGQVGDLSHKAFACASGYNCIPMRKRGIASRLAKTPTSAINGANGANEDEQVGNICEFNNLGRRAIANCVGANV